MSKLFYLFNLISVVLTSVFVSSTSLKDDDVVTKSDKMLLVLKLCKRKSDTEDQSSTDSNLYMCKNLASSISPPEGMFSQLTQDGSLERVCFGKCNHNQKDESKVGISTTVRTRREAHQKLMDESSEKAHHLVRRGWSNDIPWFSRQYSGTGSKATRAFQYGMKRNSPPGIQSVDEALAPLPSYFPVMSYITPEDVPGINLLYPVVESEGEYLPIKRWQKDKGLMSWIKKDGQREVVENDTDKRWKNTGMSWIKKRNM